jgi:hypothetical protein
MILICVLLAENYCETNLYHVIGFKRWSFSLLEIHRPLYYTQTFFLVKGLYNTPGLFFGEKKPVQAYSSERTLPAGF